MLTIVFFSVVKVGKAEQTFVDPRQFEPIERMVAEFVRDVNPDYLTINETGTL